jgi:tyrosyl-tRNA synthetase
MPMDVDQALATLCAGTEKVLSKKELADKLREGRPLRAKLGLDPTSPDIHLGHTVVFEKLRQFQELGHQAVLIIGDFTAAIGDPSGRSATRPPLSRETILANAKTYTTQAFKVLDEDKTEVVFNGDWFRKMNFEDVLRLNSRVTMQQMLQRDDFTKSSTPSCRVGTPSKCAPMSNSEGPINSSTSLWAVTCRKKRECPNRSS